MRPVIYVLSIICVTLLLFNFYLIEKLDKSLERESEWKFKYETSQRIYDLTRDEVLRLEDENQLLGSLLGQYEVDPTIE